MSVKIEDGGATTNLTILSGGVLYQTSLKVDTIAELKTIQGVVDGQVVDLLGYYEKGDGGDNKFYWDASSTTTSNDVTVVKSTGVDTGRWILKIRNSTINAVAGGLDASSNDNYSVLQNLVDVAPENSTIIFPENEAIDISQKVIITKSLKIDLNGSEITLTASSGKVFEFVSQLETYSIDVADQFTISENDTSILISDLPSGIDLSDGHLLRFTTDTIFSNGSGSNYFAGYYNDILSTDGTNVYFKYPFPATMNLTGVDVYDPLKNSSIKNGTLKVSDLGVCLQHVSTDFEISNLHCIGNDNAEVGVLSSGNRILINNLQCDDFRAFDAPAWIGYGLSAVGTDVSVNLFSSRNCKHCLTFASRGLISRDIRLRGLNIGNQEFYEGKQIPTGNTNAGKNQVNAPLDFHGNVLDVTVNNSTIYGFVSVCFIRSGNVSFSECSFYDNNTQTISGLSETSKIFTVFENEFESLSIHNCKFYSVQNKTTLIHFLLGYNDNIWGRVNITDNEFHGVHIYIFDVIEDKDNESLSLESFIVKNNHFYESFEGSINLFGIRNIENLIIDGNVFEYGSGNQNDKWGLKLGVMFYGSLDGTLRVPAEITNNHFKHVGIGTGCNDIVIDNLSYDVDISNNNFQNEPEISNIFNKPFGNRRQFQDYAISIGDVYINENDYLKETSAPTEHTIYYKNAEIVKNRSLSASNPLGWVADGDGRAHLSSTGDVTSGSNKIENVTNPSTWRTGYKIKGTGIPSSTYISAVDGTDVYLVDDIVFVLKGLGTDTGVTLFSDSASIDDADAITGDITTSNAYLDNVSDTSVFSVGDDINCRYMPRNTYIIAITTNRLWLGHKSINEVTATATNTGVTLSDINFLTLPNIT